MFPRMKAGLPIDVNSKIGLKSTSLSFSACLLAPITRHHSPLLSQRPLTDPPTPNTPAPKIHLSPSVHLILKCKSSHLLPCWWFPNSPTPEASYGELTYIVFEDGISWLKRNADFRNLCPVRLPYTWPSAPP